MFPTSKVGLNCKYGNVASCDQNRKPVRKANSVELPTCVNYRTYYLYNKESAANLKPELEMTAQSRKFNRFGRRGCYQCARCGKQTRDTGNGEASVEHCARCLHIEEARNSHNDNGFAIEQHQANKLCPVCHPELEVK